MEENLIGVIFEGGNNSEDIMEQFLSSGYYKENELDLVRFLDADKTINLEKFELAIILLIENLEFSVNVDMPIYINLGNMEGYILIRELTDMDRIIEESSFILGFSQAIATENQMTSEVIVRFKGAYDV